MNTIKTTTTKLTWTNHLNHIISRLGINRNGYIVEPGLYKVGTPDKEAPVFVTANYSLSFDGLRSNLTGMNCYILVLDTKGVNVWCAAGKGTFGTEELVNRIRQTELANIVVHKKLILPQLGAPGIAAHEVTKATGFKVTYGPVRADDIPQYIKEGHASKQMRQVQFTLKDRLVLIPLEVVFAILPISLISAVLFFLSGSLAAAAFFAAAIAGVTLMPLLLPWIPTPNFITKGYCLGLFIMLPFALLHIRGTPGAPLWNRIAWIAVYLLSFPVVTAFGAFNLPGITTFTSWSGVRREIKHYAPIMVWLFLPGLAGLIFLSVMRFI